MSFAPHAPADIAALIASHPLAWVISRDFDATPLPLLAECDGQGRLVTLVGHYAQRNPQVAAFEEDPHALILFNGPQGYVSPTLVSNPLWGATWNYATIRVLAEIAFVPSETDTALRQLAAHLEPQNGWQVDAMGDRYERMMDYIVAFRATVTSCEAVFKLGQDEAKGTFEEIVASHPNRNLARAMLDQTDRPRPNRE